MPDNNIHTINITSSDANTDDVIFPTLSMILIVSVLVILFILFYYLWYTGRSNLTGDDIPAELHGDNDDTVISVFEKIKNRYGSYVALRFRNNKDKDVMNDRSDNNQEKNTYSTITYTNYWIETEKFSQRLLYFIGPHSRVAILSFNRPEWFYAHMGTIMSNGISIGICPTTTPDNCAYIIDHSCVDLVIVENLSQLAKIKDAKISTVRLILTFDDLSTDRSAEPIIELIRSNNPNLEILHYAAYMDNPLFNMISSASTEITEIEVSKPHPDDIATIIYTSDFTEKTEQTLQQMPKGVVQTHKSIMSSIRACIYAVQTRSNIDIHIGENYISYLPLSHIATQLSDIYIPIFSVGTVTFADSDALKGSLKYTIKDARPTIFIGIPSVWENIEKAINSDLAMDGISGAIKRLVSSSKVIQMKIGLDRAKYCISVTTPIRNSTRQFFANIGIELCDVYGMNETCGPISMGVPGSSKDAGIPIMDVKIDADTSEIMVRGDSLFKEYYKDNEATDNSYTKSKHIKRRWFKTGDTGHIDRSGSLSINGHIKAISS